MLWHSDPAPALRMGVRWVGQFVGTDLNSSMSGFPIGWLMKKEGFEGLPP